MGSLRIWALGFLRGESGAVTADWAVLTASVAGMGIAVALALTPAATLLSGKLTSVMAEPAVEDVIETEGDLALAPEEAPEDEDEKSGKDREDIKDGGDYAYKPFFFGAEELDAVVKEAAASARQNLTEKEVVAAYHESVRAFEVAVERGATRDAAYALDKLHIWDRTMAEVGVDAPKDAPTVQDLDQKYRETLERSNEPQTLVRSQRR